MTVNDFSVKLDLPDQSVGRVIAVTDQLREEAMRKLSDLSLMAREAGDMKTMYAANRAWNELSRISREPSPANPLRWPPRGGAVFARCGSAGSALAASVASAHRLARFGNRFVHEPMWRQLPHNARISPLAQNSRSLNFWNLARSGQRKRLDQKP